MLLISRVKRCGFYFYAQVSKSTIIDHALRCTRSMTASIPHGSSDNDCAGLHSTMRGTATAW